MRWFQVDATTPHDPKIRAVIAHCGMAGFGGLVSLWCFVAEHGSKPGWSLDSHGKPIPQSWLVAASGLTAPDFGELLAVLLETRHVDPKAWKSGILAFPAMTKRADTYTQRRTRTRGSVRTLAEQGTNTVRTPSAHGANVRTVVEQCSPFVPLQDNTKQDNTNKTRQDNTNKTRQKNKYSGVRSTPQGTRRTKTKSHDDTGHGDTPPAPSYRRVLAVARDVIHNAPSALTFAELKDRVKSSCAAREVAYDAEVVGKALESALAIRAKTARPS